MTNRDFFFEKSKTGGQKYRRQNAATHCIGYSRSRICLRESIETEREQLIIGRSRDARPVTRRRAALIELHRDGAKHCADVAGPSPAC